MVRKRVLGGVAVIAAALAVGTVPAVQAGAFTVPASATPAPTRDGWNGIVRETVRIPMDDGWVAEGELSYPRGTTGPLPAVVLLHGSGKNDMNQTLAPGVSTFPSIAQAANRQGFAVLRFNKRGVIGVGPKLTEDPRYLYPAKPFEQIIRDAAAAVRFAQGLKRVDGKRVFLLGHSEGTVVAGNLSADPKVYGIRTPAGVIAMGVVGGTVRDTLYYQAIGTLLGRLHEQFDFDGDGRLTAAEATAGLIGQPAPIAGQLRAALLDGDRINAALDTDHDGTLAIDTEVEAAQRAAGGFDKFPDIPGAPRGFADYLSDFGRFTMPAGTLPRYAGPVLLLNGETDIQTRVRAAITVDARLTAAGNRDHRLIVYPRTGHMMNVTDKYDPTFGAPDRAVVDDIGAWLAGHR
jgi:pimeloyl-ACP methyl ester carboxylesterase